MGLFLTLAFFASCEEDSKEFGDIIAPSNVLIEAEIEGQDVSNPELMYGDGSGFVSFESNATNVISYSYNFGDGSTVVAPSGKIKHRFTKVGVNTFTVVVSAIGTAGVTSTTSMDVMVYSSFSDVEAEDISYACTRFNNLCKQLDQHAPVIKSDGIRWKLKKESFNKTLNPEHEAHYKAVEDFLASAKVLKEFEPYNHDFHLNRFSDSIRMVGLELVIEKTKFY